MSDVKREQGQKVIGQWLDFRFGVFGKTDAPVMQVLMKTDKGEETTMIFLGDKKGSDGLTNSERIMDRLVEFGCDPVRLKAPGWKDHINLTMRGKTIQADVHVFGESVSLRNLSVPGAGGGFRLATVDSPPWGGGGGSPW